VEDLIFTIAFKGRVKITWFLHRLYYSRRILGENYAESIGKDPVQLPLEFWPDLEDGMLAFEVEALEETEIYNFSYSTNSPVKNKVSLGIVITHFNRQKYVLPALERLKSELLGDVNFTNKVTLFVVDNSRNLPETKGVNIIPNENLGGAGGFTRGLMHLIESGKYTHCLFMDDDASCEVDGIKRTVTLLEHAKDPEMAVGGAMLHETEMFRQFECGARFDGICRANKSGFDLRFIPKLLANELEERIDYVGWWFFAFPLSKVKHFAFPYFVRGDDVGFGLAHKFNIVMLNGICSWQADFALKNGPLPQYLDTRSHIMHNFHGLVGGGFKGLLITTAKMTLRNLLTYNYETALASVVAIEDVAKGKEFWVNNVDMAEKRKEIASMTSAEKPRDIPFSISIRSVLGNPYEGRTARIFRWLTLNGHLLPRIFFKKGMVQQPKAYGGSLRQIYRYEKVLYIHIPTSRGFVLEHSKKKFFYCGLRYLKAICKLSMNYKKLKKEYASSYDALTGTEFWEKQFRSNHLNK
jgi:hypothetical protein